MDLLPLLMAENKRVCLGLFQPTYRGYNPGRGPPCTSQDVLSSQVFMMKKE